MNFALNKSTMKVGIIVIATLLLINTVATMVPAVATIKAKMGLN